MPLLVHNPTYKPPTGVPVRISVHDIGGTHYKGRISLKLKQEGKSISLTRAKGDVIFRAFVEPGTYEVEVKAGELVSPARKVVVGSEGKSTSVYLGKKDWPYYRMGEHLVPFEPPKNRSAVVFEVHNPLNQHGQDIDDIVKVLEEEFGFKRDLYWDTEELPISNTSQGSGAKDFITAESAILLFNTENAVDAETRQKVRERLREQWGPGVRLGIPVDLKQQQVKVLDNEFVIRAKDETAFQKIRSALEEKNGQITRPLIQAPLLYMIAFHTGDYQEHLDIIEDWMAEGYLHFGEPDLLVEIHDHAAPPTLPDDLNLTSQHNFFNQEVPGAWEILKDLNPDWKYGNPEVVIATVDSGINRSGHYIHDDIGGVLTNGEDQIAACLNFTTNPVTNCGHDHSYHGLAVQGIIAAITDNSKGLAGIASNTIQVAVKKPSVASARYVYILLWLAGLPVHTSIDPGLPINATWVWQVLPPNHHADIINCSHGCMGNAACDLYHISYELMAIQGRGGKGTLVVYSAGNQGKNIFGYETMAADDHTFAVANSTARNVSGQEFLYPCSNFGDEIDTSATGVNVGILSTGNPSGHTTRTGTSYSAPSLSAALGLLLSHEPDLTFAQVKVRLQNTTNPLNPTALPPIATCPQDAGHGISGFGRLNVANLVAGFQAEVIPSSDFLFFTDIPEGPATSRPIVFSVKARQPVDLEVVSGAGGNFSLPFSKVSLGVADDGSPRTARVWVTYTPGLAGSSATTTIRVRWTQTMQEWDIAVAANTTDPVKTGVLLVLDQSGSMERTSGLGPGVTRADVLRYSIPPFINLMEAHHGIGIVAFDHNPYEELGITPATPSGKASANAVLGAYEPNDGGFTSIGEAVAKGQDMLSSETLYDNRVMVVFTDGQENHGRYSRRYIADVEHLIDDHVFAVGLGTASQIRPSALRALCNDHNGYLLLTDTISADSQFRLAKYFHQILAGIENKDIILDPDGRLYEGLAQEIPFLVSGTTYQIEVVLLSPGPRLISMTLETPSGKTINVEVSDSHPAVQFEANGIMQFYRINLPILTEDEVIRQGWWKVHLSLRPKHVSLISAYHPGLLSAARAEAQAAAQPAMRSVPFSLNVYSRSTLKLQAALDQSSFEAGGSAYITVNLEEVGIPLEARAFVRAEITYPRGQQEEIRLEEVIPGRFEAAVDLRQDGVYSFRILSQGQTLGGDPFQREKVLTAQVWRNGNQPAPRSPRPSEQQSSAWSQWLDCLLKQKSFWHWLETQGLDVEELRACMKKSKVKSASGTPPADDASQDWKSMLKELLCHPDLIAYLDEDDG